MIWRPYQQMKNLAPPFRIVDAEGVFLYTENRRLIDSTSSWWCAIHGHKHPVITNAIVEQAKRFSHVALAGLTHDPVERLSAKLEEILPGDLKYSFFSDSGSVAVEVALKMALQYHVNKGNFNRTRILSLKHAYHGDTFKTMEAGDYEEYHFILNAYGKKRYNVHIPTTITDLESAFERYGEELNCFIVEPLLQCAGGMRVYNVSFLKRARELCDKFDVLLIFDEVATGFGRTGNRFVSDLVHPDVTCLGKALTGGTLVTRRPSPTKKFFRLFTIPIRKKR